MVFEKIFGPKRGESAEQSEPKSSRESGISEADRQAQAEVVRQKESERQGALARIRDKIFGTSSGAAGNVSGREHTQGKAKDPGIRQGGNFERGDYHTQGKAQDPGIRQGGNFEPGDIHTQGKAQDPGIRQGGNFERGDFHTQGKAQDPGIRQGGNFERGDFHTQGKAQDPGIRQGGNFERGDYHTQGKAIDPGIRQGGNFESGDYHTQGKAIDPGIRQGGNFESGDYHTQGKSKDPGPWRGGNMPNVFLSEEEIREQQREATKPRVLRGKKKQAQEISGITAYDNGSSWVFKVGWKDLGVAKDHPRLQEIAAALAEAEKAFNDGDEDAGDKFVAKAARIEQGKE